jgi:hypothetical protein
MALYALDERDEALDECATAVDPTAFVRSTEP